MGNPVKIVDLAKRMISLYGHQAGIDMEISFVGLRPGEKMHEELFNSYEVITKTPYSKINTATLNVGIDRNILELLNNPELYREASDINNILDAYRLESEVIGCAS